MTTRVVVEFPDDDDAEMFRLSIAGHKGIITDSDDYEWRLVRPAKWLEAKVVTEEDHHPDMEE